MRPESAGKWIRRKLRSPVSLILLGSLVGQGAILLVSPLLTRYYGPETFGTYALVVAIASILGGLVTLSWERAVVVPQSETDTSCILALGAMSAIALASLAAVSGYLGRDLIAAWLGNEVFVDYWWLVPATALSIGSFALVSQLLVRLRNYRALAVRNAVLGGSQAAFSVALGFFGVTPLGLISSVLVGRVVAMAGLSGVLRGWWPRKRLSCRLIRATASRYRNFPLISTWSRVLNIAGLQLPVVLIVALYGSVEAGLFALTVRVLAMPASFVTEAVAQYFEGVLAHRARNALGGLRAFVIRVSKHLAAVAVVPAVTILIFGPALFSIIFGTEWREAGEVARIMSVAYFAQFAVAPVSKTLLVLERQALLLAWDIHRALLTVGAVMLPYLLGLGFRSAIMYLTGAQVVAYGLLLYACAYAARDREGAPTTGSAVVR